MQPEEAALFYADFSSIDEITERFLRYQIPITQFQNAITATARRLLVTHSIGYAAVIQLHKNFASVSTESSQKCLNAASSMVKIIDISNIAEVGYLNPIMGVCWF